MKSLQAYLLEAAVKWQSELTDEQRAELDPQDVASDFAIATDQFVAGLPKK
jgi:hypothetical protein